MSSKAECPAIHDADLKRRQAKGVAGSRLNDRHILGGLDRWTGDVGTGARSNVEHARSGTIFDNLSKRLVDDSKYLTPNYTGLDGGRSYIKVVFIGMAAPDDQIIRKTQWFGIDTGPTPRFIGLLKQPKHLI